MYANNVEDYRFEKSKAMNTSGVTNTTTRWNDMVIVWTIIHAISTTGMKSISKAIPHTSIFMIEIATTLQPDYVIPKMYQKSGTPNGNYLLPDIWWTHQSPDEPSIFPEWFWTLTNLSTTGITILWITKNEICDLSQNPKTRWTPITKESPIPKMKNGTHTSNSTEKC